MSVHLVADNAGKIAELRAMLAPYYAVTSSLLDGENIGHGEFDAVAIAADLKAVENISALKEIFPKFRSARKRIFIIDQTARLLVCQAYALGATHVLSHSASQPNLLAILADSDTRASPRARLQVGRSKLPRAARLRCPRCSPLS